MRRTLAFISAALVVAAFGLFSGCGPIEGGAPQNFKLEAADDGAKVKLSWEEPEEGAPSEYVVYFKALGAAEFTEVTTLTATSYLHDPSNHTGDYKVAASFDGEEYDSDVKSTIPKHTGATSVSELNAAGNSGYGWDRTTWSGGTYTMTEAANATAVDFYITDFAIGYVSTPYAIASPDETSDDPGNTGFVPSGAWKTNAFSNPVTDPNAPLPVHSTTTYFNYTDIETDPTYLGAYTADGYYALVKLSGVNTGAGTVQAETWFQPIKGLRLVEH